MASAAVQNDVRYAGEGADVQAAAFQALEQRVLRAIEMLRTERELRAAAEGRANAAEEHSLNLEIKIEEQTRRMDEQHAHIQSLDARLAENEGRLAENADQMTRMQNDLSQLNGERDQVRERVERLLQHLDEFTGG